MKFIISLWDKPVGELDEDGTDNRTCAFEEVELTEDDLYTAAIRKAKRKRSELYNWQLERIEP